MAKEEYAGKIDLVCGMALNECKAVETAEFEGKTYGFCSAGCKESFKVDPKKFIENPSSRKMMPGHKGEPEKH
jgi:YHS domain-containing protein